MTLDGFISQEPENFGCPSGKAQEPIPRDGHLDFAFACWLS
jgi:hypothetical protein